MSALLAVALLAAWPSSARALEVTVYNQNLGLIKERRAFDLKRGTSDASAVDVAAQIDPTSVHLRCLSSPVSVLEQDFEYDLLSSDKLLQKYVGKDIELQRLTGANGEKREILRGTLLSNAGGRIVRSDGRVYVNPPGDPILPELPEGLLIKPTLVWTLDASQAGRQDCEISYLTGGLSWSADYVAVANAADDQMDLNAWVTVTNASGATYRDARLKLVAGDVHRAPAPVRARYAAKVALMAADGAAVQERPFFEYHLYSLPRPSTVRDNETKQLELASASGVPLKKTYTYQGATVFGSDYNEYTRSDPNFGTGGQKKVWVMLAFLNSKAHGLGLPLPAGRLRVFKADADGSLQFAGEDSIDHTPKDEEVRVKMGDAFDLVGERTRTSFQMDTHRRWFEESFEIRLRNHKDSAVTINVVEPLYRWTSWKIASSSTAWKKKDSQTIAFDVPVPKDGEAVVDYTVRYSW